MLMKQSFTFYMKNSSKLNTFVKRINPPKKKKRCRCKARKKIFLVSATVKTSPNINKSISVQQNLGVPSKKRGGLVQQEIEISCFKKLLFEEENPFLLIMPFKALEGGRTSPLGM